MSYVRHKPEIHTIAKSNLLLTFAVIARFGGTGAPDKNQLLFLTPSSGGHSNFIERLVREALVKGACLCLQYL